MTKEQEILDLLSERVFDPILDSPKASEALKKGVRYTIMRLKERDAAGMVSYYWSAIVGTDRSVSFAPRCAPRGSRGSRRSSTSSGAGSATRG